MIPTCFWRTVMIMGPKRSIKALSPSDSHSFQSLKVFPEKGCLPFIFSALLGCFPFLFTDSHHHTRILYIWKPDSVSNFYIIPILQLPSVPQPTYSVIIPIIIWYPALASPISYKHSPISDQEISLWDLKVFNLNEIYLEMKR